MDSSLAPVGRLVVCPTPIGNLEDVTLRVLEELRHADTIACEDTRHARVLLNRHGIHGRLLSLHEHNEAGRAGELASRISGGAVIALISDAGTPLVSDPGYLLIQACLEASLAVEVLPGASAVVTALVASGLPADRWCFVGFLPRKRGDLDALLKRTTETLIAFESPRRVGSTLAVLAALDPGRPVALCRELTKLHEEVVRGSARDLAARYAENPPRGEVVLVFGAAPAGRSSLALALAALRELIDAGAKARPAAVAVAKLTGLGANELYRELMAAGQ